MKGIGNPADRVRSHLTVARSAVTEARASILLREDLARAKEFGALACWHLERAIIAVT